MYYSGKPQFREQNPWIVVRGLGVAGRSSRKCISDLQYLFRTMAKREVTGGTKEEIQSLRESFKGEDFDATYCLAKIPRQPEDYTGPPRYCKNTRTSPTGSNHLCKHHGGDLSDDFNEENLDKLAPMKHGIHATREHLIEDFDDKDTALYDWIVDTYPDAYDINTDEDPAALYDLHRLAAEIVRAERGRGFLLREGEVKEDPVRNEEGRVVIDDEGNVVTEKSEHYLAQMMYRQDNKITKLEKELGISRKEQMKQDTSDEAVEAITKGFSELGAAFLQREDKEYDPEDEPWDEDDN